MRRRTRTLVTNSVRDFSLLAFPTLSPPPPSPSCSLVWSTNPCISPMNSQIQETAKVSRQEAARARGQDPGDRKPGGAGPQDTAAATVHQPARHCWWRFARCPDGRGQERGPEEGHEEGEEGQDQGGELPQVYVKMRQGAVGYGCVINWSEASEICASDRMVGVLYQMYLYHWL